MIMTIYFSVDVSHSLKVNHIYFVLYIFIAYPNHHTHDEGHHLHPSSITPASIIIAMSNWFIIVPKLYPRYVNFSREVGGSRNQIYRYRTRYEELMMI